jgi:Uma2 family endonuclease
MATDIRRSTTRPSSILRGVDWKAYNQLRDHPGNGHLRMSYLDGTLIHMSPQYIHDFYGRRIGLVVDLVTEALDIPIQGTLTTTLRKKSQRHRKGAAKEPDQAFYFGPNVARMNHRRQIDLEIDPPPDLAIEVDHKADSARALKIYAGLGVPELWRYQARTGDLWFGKLVDQGYVAIDRSINLPRLTPELVLYALTKLDELGETRAKPWLRDWARNLTDPTV